jgi:hypothetical protein
LLRAERAAVLDVRGFKQSREPMLAEFTQLIIGALARDPKSE